MRQIQIWNAIVWNRTGAVNLKANKTLVQKTPKICYSFTVQVQKFRIWLYGFIAKLNTEINLINMLTLQQN